MTILTATVALMLVALAAKADEMTFDTDLP